MTVAFDIETCPRPMAALNERQRRRYDMLFAAESMKNASATLDDISRKVRSLHPDLGWICCVSLAQRNARGEVSTKSWTARSADHEWEALYGFWSYAQEHHARSLVVSFNGKFFDAGWLRDRSLVHGILLPPVAARFCSTHRWQNTPHCDLAHLVHPTRIGLADLCDRLGVETSKGDLDGSQVAGAVERGEIARVARYCEADTVATLECFEVLSHLAAPLTPASR